MKLGNLSTSYSGVIIGLAVLLYRTILDFTYILYLEPQFGYAGFHLEIVTIKIILSYLALLLLYSLTPKTTNKPSDMVIQFFFLMVYVPFSSYYGLSNSNSSWFILFSLFWFFVFLITRFDIEFKSIRSPNIELKNMVKVFTAIVIAVFILLFVFTDFKLNFNLMKVYELRSESDLDNLPLSGYFINWTAKVILPFLMLYYLYSANRGINIGFIIFTIALILIFATTGHKDYLFRIPMMIGTVVLLKSKKFYQYFTLTLCAISLGGLLFFLLLDNEYPSSFMVRRTLFLPAQISYYYYDFFTNNAVYLSNSLLKSYIEYPYELETPRIIGLYYMGSDETSANNGIVSDGYMHFGVWGMMLWGLLLIVLLKLTDSISKGKNNLIVWPLVLLSYKTIIDGAFFTTLLTHGLLLTLLIIFLVRKSDDSTIPK
jgi:hypothetical protein